MAVVAYLTHPLGEADDMTGLHNRQENLSNAIQWFKFLVMTTRWVITCPWYIYAVGVDDVFHRPRALRDQVELIGRSDLVIACGGRFSGHMRIDCNHARNRIDGSVPVLDLIHYGVHPPWDTKDQAQIAILKTARDLGL